MISPHAIVATGQIGAGVTIHEFAVVRAGVVLGDNVTIHPHVVIEQGVVLGDNITIHPHVVIEQGVEIDSGSEIFAGCTIGKRPHGAGATARPIAYEQHVKLGEGCAVGPNAVIFYDVRIGSNTLVGDGASIREGCSVGERCIIGRHVTINYNVSIGERTKIMDLTHITGNCSIGRNVFISTHVALANDLIILTRAYDEQQLKGPQIDDHVIIGSGAGVLPNIRLGEGSVVGAGALVTKDVAPYDLVMGTPARVVKNVRAERGG